MVAEPCSFSFRAGGQENLDFTYCDGDYEWHILVPGDRYPAVAKWDEDYYDMVGRAMFALYNHAVTEGRKSAYESRQAIIKAMSILIEEVPRFGFTNTVPSKGNPILVAPGVRFIERNHSDPASAYYMEAIEGARVKPCTLFKENGLQFTWRARDTETDRIVDYGVIDIALHYGPMLFQNFEDSEKFWNEGYVRIVKA